MSSDNRPSPKAKLIVSVFVVVFGVGYVLYEQNQAEQQPPKAMGTDVRGVKAQTAAPVSPEGTAMAAAQAQGDAWLIEPGKRVGPITAQSTLADLQKAFGEENVQKTDIQMGEGETVPGLKIYPKDPNKALEVVLKANTETPESVVLREGTQWHTADGVKVGSKLKELEALNGGPFVLTGFYWDYGGTVMTWGNGKLRDKYQKNGSLMLRLQPADNAPEALTSKVTGDSEFKSSDPAMQQLNPYVYELFVGL